VGKVAIPDSVLLKPGPLTPEERLVIETHAEIGHRLLDGSDSAVLQLAATIALTHHEHYDGGGYPRGLAGENIPVEGRIVAIVDVFDALTSDRVYRSAMSIDQALAILRDGRSTHFDPVLLDHFMHDLQAGGGVGSHGWLAVERGARRRPRLTGPVDLSVASDDPVVPLRCRYDPESR
jgi:putative two-component system response regulator